MIYFQLCLEDHKQLSLKAKTLTPIAIPLYLNGLKILSFVLRFFRQSSILLSFELMLHEIKIASPTYFDNYPNTFFLRPQKVHSIAAWDGKRSWKGPPWLLSQVVFPIITLVFITSLPRDRKYSI